MVGSIEDLIANAAWDPAKGMSEANDVAGSGVERNEARRLMSRFARKCRYASCSSTTKHDSGYCEHHAKHRRTESLPGSHRDRWKGFYKSPAWRKLRRMILDARPLCEECRREPSTTVDHIVSIFKGGAPLDPANCRALGAKCHNRKTAREDGGFGNKRK